MYAITAAFIFLVAATSSVVFSTPVQSVEQAANQSNITQAREVMQIGMAAKQWAAANPLATGQIPSSGILQFMPPFTDVNNVLVNAAQASISVDASNNRIVTVTVNGLSGQVATLANSAIVNAAAAANLPSTTVNGVTISAPVPAPLGVRFYKDLSSFVGA